MSDTHLWYFREQHGSLRQGLVDHLEEALLHGEERLLQSLPHALIGAATTRQLTETQFRCST